LGYDADWWRERRRAAGHQPVVPGRRNRLIQPAYDEYTYRSRHLIENAFARLKSSRRIATRYEQTTIAYAPSSHWPASSSGSCDFEDVP
jgi:transposase